MFSAFEALLFYNFEQSTDGTILHKTGKLSKTLDKKTQELLEKDAIDIDTSNVIVNLPIDISETDKTVETHKDKGCIIIKGITSDTQFQSIEINDIPFSLPKKTGEETELTDFFSEEVHNFKALLNNLADFFQINLVVSYATTTDSYNVTIKLFGTLHNITSCKHQLLAFVDLLTNKYNKNENYTIEYVNLDSYSLLPFISNPQNFNFIENHLLTTVFVPSLSLYAKDYTTQLILTSNIHSLLLKTKKIIKQNLDHLEESIYYKKMNNISEAKLLFLKKFCYSDIISFMIKSSCFIKLNDNSIEFQTTSPIYLNNVIKEFTLVFLQEIVQLTILLNENTSCENMIKQIMDKKLFNSTYIIIKSSSVTDRIILCINHSDLINSINNSVDTNIIKDNENVIKQLKIVFEVNMDYEDFICGKKNGKLTRIIDNVKSLVELSNNSKTTHDNEDTTMNISIISETFNDFKCSTENFINELPAEESFFIPEVYHRPIIGAGGAIVQTIMRKHNVFIQFSNSFSLPQDNFGIKRYDNVIIRCPTKNKQNIRFAKDEIFSLVDNFSYLQISQYLNLTNNRFENIILSSNNINLMKLIQLEKMYNVFIDFPDDLSRSDNEPVVLRINGNDRSNTLEAMSDLINDKSEWIKEMTLKLSSNFRQYIQNKTNFAKLFNEVIIPIEQSFNQVFISFSPTNSQISISFNDDINENSKDTINKVIEFVTSYFIKQGITVINKIETPDVIEE